MTRWFRKLRRKRYIWCVVVLSFSLNGKSRDPHRVGPFYTKTSAKKYRKAWDKQFKGFAVVDKYPNGAAVEGLVAMKWNT